MPASKSLGPPHVPPFELRKQRFSYSSRALKILIADDDPVSIQLIKRYLQTDGYQIIETYNGEEAWHKVIHEHPDLIISDWCMPDISGLDLCKRIKGNPENPGLSMIYFILVTAFANMTYRGAGLAAGADEFLAKPLDPSELRARVRAGMRLSLLTQSLLKANQQLEAQNKLLESLSLTDPLTGLLNRRAMDEALPQLISTLNLSNTTSLSLLMIDIDHFKVINDSYGHLIGDQVLKAIAGRLQNNSFSNSLVYRYGGEEFVCITANLDQQNCQQLCQQLISAIADHNISINELLLPVTVSIGAAIACQCNVVNGPTLLAQADLCLYQAKQAGRNRFELLPTLCAVDS